MNKLQIVENQHINEIANKVKTSLDRWVTFLTRNDLLETDNLPKQLNSPELGKALHVLNVMSFSQQERELYEEHVKWLRIEANTLKKAEEKELAKRIIQGSEQSL